LADGALRSILKRERLLVAASLTALFLLSWLFLLYLAREMETMEGAAARMMGMPTQDALAARLAAALSPGAAALADASVSFALVALMWAVMMVGMMLPSAAPTILLFSVLEGKRDVAGGTGGRTSFFVAGYFAIWSLFSVAAAGVQTSLSHAGLISMEMAARSSLLAGAILVGAGVYELTPLKDRCLTHCRSPLEWIPQHMRSGRGGVFRMGIEHGAYCVGCCWMLMLLLFVGGVMNLVWVAFLAGLVLVQKVLRGGAIAAKLSGAILILFGAFVILRPLVVDA
jgi:predicted metal-binding membrane protein